MGPQEYGLGRSQQAPPYLGASPCWAGGSRTRVVWQSPGRGLLRTSLGVFRLQPGGLRASLEFLGHGFQVAVVGVHSGKLTWEPERRPIKDLSKASFQVQRFFFFLECGAWWLGIWDFWTRGAWDVAPNWELGMWRKLARAPSVSRTAQKSILEAPGTK